MPNFCIYDHPRMPVVRASVTERRRDTDKDGFRLRYVMPFPEELSSDAEATIDALDVALGARTKARGVYQASYDDVRAAYQIIRGEPEEVRDVWEPVRALAFVGAVLLVLSTAALLALGTIMWLFWAILQRRSGVAATVEAAILWDILDWRPLARRLFTYSRDGTWK